MNTTVKQINIVFEGWYGDKNAKILCIMIKQTNESETPVLVKRQRA